MSCTHRAAAVEFSTPNANDIFVIVGCVASNRLRIGDLRPEAAIAVRSVRSALKVIADRMEAEVVSEKAPFDLTTGTDTRTQTVIRSILEQACPEHGFVGEEGRPHADAGTATYWLVDPICGTRNFASKLPLYCVNVALVDGVDVVLGVVGDGARGEVWVAERGRGAWSEDDGVLRSISASAASRTVGLDPGRPGGPAAANAAKVIAAAITQGRWELRTLGTTVDLAYLASGRLAALWHFSRIPPLHFAAGALLASEAGAIVTDERGSAWRLSSEGIVAAAAVDLHTSLLALLD